MATMAVCGALVLAGVLMVVRWGGKAPPAGTAAPSGRSRRPVAERLLRLVGIPLAAGLTAGVIAAGAGGRLVMRLLAITSPDAAGSVTEAGETVGRISVDGTLGFIVFAGVPAGLLSGVVYALVRPLLPAGRAGGVSLGVLLLVLAATRIEPLRSDNFDFSLVGPAWLAVLAFASLGLFLGMLVTAVAERLYRRLPESPPGADRQRNVKLGRIAVGALLLAALPGFLSSVADIL